ncbi:MAG TPA: hypothetical protein VLA48_02320 [Nitrososphaeraceae archaeon]|nr:hypothetical protein [Nitrososphaeraceae archaeon]
MQILTNEEEDNKLYTNFIYSIRGEITRKKYLTNLKYYMKFLGITTFKELLGNGNKHQKIIESDIKEYLIYLRTKKKLSYGSTIMYLAPIKKFYYVNSDYQFKWDLINMYLGNDDTTSTDDDEDNGRNRILEEEDEEDRPYTMEEVKSSASVDVTSF